MAENINDTTDGLIDKIILWFYKNDVDVSPNTVTSSSNSSEWTKFRDIEIEIIEEAYQESKVDVLLDKHRIDLKNLIQIRLDDNKQQGSVKREIVSSRTKCLRQSRFSGASVITSEAISSTTYGTFDSWCPFMRSWLMSSAGKRAWLHLPSCIEACAQGIIQEALQHDSNSNTEAAFMAKRIRQCVGQPRLAVSRLCIRFYTKDSFLYDVLNKALRELDLSKLETLGPLGYLISAYSRDAQEFVGTVYRGVELKYTEIEQYKCAIGMWKTWPAYTSTSKNRKMAEFYGNTLFVIEITDNKLSAPRTFDISNISSFPEEEEVLLPAGACFQIINVTQNREQKYIIDIQI
ncbi:unnamed protein product [Rotaria socialis]|uniref:NAD(P)(+)--arginine ADP-ribosyltransferase n=1 Tax=Rotaria socialis TaxID=392032 RepID=A0A817XPK1_9BILA|nr:unnamed protein product [Rotaria socialis]CAF4644956.1 unnamed protein product [Rotaria socialis]